MTQMKKIMTMLLILTSLLFVFTACSGQMSGTYALISNVGFGEESEDLGEEPDGTFYTFNGDKVTLTVRTLGVIVNSSTATYRINGDKITFTSDEISRLAMILDMSTGKYTSTHSFAKGEDYIKIDNNIYTKQ